MSWNPAGNPLEGTSELSGGTPWVRLVKPEFFKVGFKTLKPIRVEPRVDSSLSLYRGGFFCFYGAALDRPQVDKIFLRGLVIVNFQDIILNLQNYWAKQGCIIQQPYDVEKGAGTMNPATALRTLGPEPWNVAYVEPSRRPTDGRYGDNPNRLQHYYQYQVILKPSPDNVIDLYLDSLKALGIDPEQHDIRFVEDNWESPTLGAWGLGWEVWLDGMEITQFTYFQQCGGFDCYPVSAEITYGLERIAMYIQNKESVYDIEWVDGISYADVHHQGEVDYSTYNFEVADINTLTTMFNLCEQEAIQVAKKQLVLPAYDYVLKCSHLFNLLDARGAISVTERTGYIGRVRNLARMVAYEYLEQRKRLNYPLLKDEALRQELLAGEEEPLNG